jgi:hypothetical protein
MQNREKDSTSKESALECCASLFDATLGQGLGDLDRLIPRLGRTIEPGLL